MTVLWIVAITNAVNLIDGLDGLANGVSAISATTMLVIALLVGEAVQVAMVMAALVGACVGFMPYNMNPAKMFMGDTGATFLGYILATMSIQGLFKFYAIISFAVPFLILGLPIFDTAFAFIRRIAHGQSPMHADRSHIHHRLIDMGLNQKQAVATLYVISAILGLSAVVLTTSGERQGHAAVPGAVHRGGGGRPGGVPQGGQGGAARRAGGAEGARPPRRIIQRTEPEDAWKDGGEVNGKAADHERLRHPAGGHQDVPPGAGAGQSARGSRASAASPPSTGRCWTACWRSFTVKPDWDLDIMTPRQTLSTITSKCLTGMDEAIDALKPDMILVHGDTSTTFAGALSAFYHQVPVGHVEAGLRTYDKYSPFPEEMNRKLVSAIADLYFCPTANNRDNLEREGITEGAVRHRQHGHRRPEDHGPARTTAFPQRSCNQLPYGEKKIILVTCHRRENYGEPMTQHHAGPAADRRGEPGRGAGVPGAPEPGGAGGGGHLSSGRAPGPSHRPAAGGRDAQPYGPVLIWC